MLAWFLPPENLNTTLPQVMAVIKVSLCSDTKLNLSLNQNSSHSLIQISALTSDILRTRSSGSLRSPRTSPERRAASNFERTGRVHPSSRQVRGRNAAWTGRLSITHTHYSLTRSSFRISAKDEVLVSGPWEATGEPWRRFPSSHVHEIPLMLSSEGKQCNS